MAFTPLIFMKLNISMAVYTPDFTKIGQEIEKEWVEFYL
jgi:hypothetical protein